MKTLHRWAALVLLLPLFAIGCSNNASISQEKPEDKEAKIKAALDQLDPADRTLAEEQKFCAVEPKNRLGSMGKPIKLTIEDEPVFVCCKSCEKAALKDPKKTLARARNSRSRRCWLNSIRPTANWRRNRSFVPSRRRAGSARWTSPSR